MCYDHVIGHAHNTGGTTGCESFCIRVIGIQLNRVNPSHKSTFVFIDKVPTAV